MTDTAEQSEKKTKKKISLGANYWKLWTASVTSNLGDGVAGIAYPWLASAVTRNALLIALIAIAQRIPWLIFTLPAGVITDRVDRRKIMTFTSVFRTVLTLAVAAVVYLNQDMLPSPGDVASGGIGTPNTVVYTTLLVSALLFGFAEVLYDNAAQTILPAIVEPEGLEKANSRLWGAEMVMNQFVGPPLGSVLIGVAFALPFFFDAGTFAIAAALIFALSGVFKIDHPASENGGERPGFWDEIKEGVKWLWSHALLRPMAIILGLMNGLFSLTFATLVLFAQEVLDVTTATFAVLMMAGAAGGVLGSVFAPKVSEKFGSGTSLYFTLIGGAVATLVIGLSSYWVMAWVMFFFFSFTAVLWNVITVSLRQTIIPDHLLGRVNSVYRFFAWGMMPIGLAIGGLIVIGAEASGLDRVMALRLPYFVSAVALFAVFLWAAPQLTTEKIETAREQGIAAKDTEPRTQSTGAE
ncbi:MAG: MFS transporter [Acidimicrobiia bacterium]|nr:MAG: MFS transporter [Acidimicrobiia bacterium]